MGEVGGAPILRKQAFARLREGRRIQGPEFEAIDARIGLGRGIATPSVGHLGERRRMTEAIANIAKLQSAGAPGDKVAVDCGDGGSGRVRSTPEGPPDHGLAARVLAVIPRRPQSYCDWPAGEAGSGAAYRGLFRHG